MTALPIAGAKGGSSSSRTPVEAPDSLRSVATARILDMVSEGPIKGPVLGPDKILQCIALDGTLVANADGSLNFQNVQFDSRAGTQDQDYMPGFPDVRDTIGVGVELKSSAPWVQAITNTDLSAVEIMLAAPNGLQQSNTSNGDITGVSVGYKIEVSTDGGAYQTAITSSMVGKATSKYERSHRVDLPPATAGWNVRVTRTTPNANSATVSDVTQVESYTEIVDAKLRYPNCALFGFTGDASQFQSIPQRAYYIDGRIIRVPSNYDPETRTYSGVWDGTFKPAYTNNPAWCYFDLVTHYRYGLGHLIKDGQINKWALYQIGQYCDQLVSDGKGGQEPRFTCDLYLQTQAAAYRVLQDMASVFRGVSYAAAGTVNAVADMPSDPVYTYTNANALGGKFTYQGSGRKTRYTVALVSWNDHTDMGRAKVEYVEDPDGVARYGIQQTQVTAVGCSSQAMARRWGNWILFTSRYETEQVGFGIGLDGTFAAPGKIVRVMDNKRAGRRVAGRVTLSTPTVVTVDAAPTVGAGDKLTVNLPTGVSETRVVKSVSGRNITVTEAFTVQPQPDCVWLVESTELTAPMYRILSVKKNGGLDYTISALRHVPEKFEQIDNGVTSPIQLPPITVIPPSVQAPPTNVRITAHEVIEQGIALTVMTISWEKPENAVAYRVQWQRNSGGWIDMGETGAQTLDVRNVATGQYLARVTAVNASNVASLPAVSELTDIVGKTEPPAALNSLTTASLVFAIRLDWTFPPRSSDTSRTEIWYSQLPDLATAIKLGDFAYPQNTHTLMGLAAGVRFYFWGRLVDKTGNIGPWYPAGAGVAGESSADASEILDYISGQIDESLLGQELQDKIAGIDVNAETIIKQSLAQYETNNETRSSRAYIARLDETKATPEEAEAIAQQTVGAQIGDLSALVQDTAEVYVDNNGNAHAFNLTKVGVTKDGQYIAAGLAVGVETVSGVPQSQILLQASRVAVVDDVNGTLKAFFVVQAGQTFIQSAFIADGSITNAKIGNVIQSTNYDGVNGWQINKNGTAYFGGDVTINGNITATSVTGAFQTNMTAAWSGPVIGNSEGATTAFALGAPVRDGENHTPVVQAELTLEGTHSSETCNSYVRLERSTNGGSTWALVREVFYSLKSVSTQTYYFQSVDTPTEDAVQYRFKLRAGDRNPGSFQLDAVNVFIFGLR